MKEVPYCLPEIFETVIAAARKVSSDHFIHEKVLDRVLAKITGKLGYGSSAESLLYEALETAYHALGVKDPYNEVKSGLNHTALAVKKMILADKSDAARSLVAFLCYSLAVSEEKVTGLSVAQLDKFLRDCLSEEIEFEASKRLQQQLIGAKKILFIAANAGEMVIDSLLINSMAVNAEVSVAVASKPVLMRAMHADAEFAGLAESVTLIDPGIGMLGVTLERASSEFREIFTEADLIIAKGGVNFETLRGCGREVFYLMYCDSRSNTSQSLGRERRVVCSSDGRDSN